MNIEKNAVLKNINIELLRVISIVMVIFIHIYSELLLDDIYSLDQIIYTPAFFKVSVPCFFMIVGYLFSTKKNLKKFWCKNLFRIVLPLIFLLVFYELLVDFLYSNVSLTYYISNLNLNFTFFKNIFLSNVLGTKGYHLWYIYVLIQLYLLYPVFKVVCLKENIKLQRYLIGLLFVFSIFIYTITNLGPNDITINFDFVYGYTYSILYFLIGYYLKDNLSKIKINKYIFLVIYFVMIFLSMASVKFFELKSNKSLLFLSSLGYNSIFIFFASIAFFIFIMKLNLKENKVILFLGKKTLFVYYVHAIFIYIALHFSMINDLYLNNSFLYCFIVMIICYLLSILCCIIFNLISKLIIKLLNGLKSKFFSR